MKVLKEILHAATVPDFEWNFPQHLLSPNTCYLPQIELDFLRRWFLEECEPDNRERRKALVLFSEKREFGKSTFARSLVSGIEDHYIEIGGVSMVETNFNCKTNARLFLVDDMEINLQKNQEMWKKLLSSQRVNLRDCYFNQEFPGGMPVIVTTNNKKIFFQLAKSSLFEDQCYFLSLSEYMGPLGTKPAVLNDDRETKRKKYHCGNHCMELAPVIEEHQPIQLSQESEDSNRFVDAVKREEWSSCYKRCPEDERQVLLTKFAEVQAQVERLKALFLSAAPPQINVFNIGPVFNQQQIIREHEDEKSNDVFREEFEQKTTIKKKLFQAHEKNQALLVPVNKGINETSNSMLNNLVIIPPPICLPGVLFDGHQLQKVTTGKEYVSIIKLRQLLAWSQKKEQALRNYNDVDQDNGGDDDFRDRQSFGLFLTYYFCCKPTHIKIQQGQELVSVETYYSPAARMRQSEQGMFGRFYAMAYYQDRFSLDRKSTGAMQNFEKKRRAYLCEDIYWDLDQINSHPSLLLSLLLNLNLKIPQLLREYVENREDVLTQIAISYETDQLTAKNLMIRLLYGGTVKNWIITHELGLPSNEILEQKLQWFIEDLYVINDRLQRLPLLQKAMHVYHDTYVQSERTPTSFLSLICGEYERQVLLFVKQWLAQQVPSRDLDVLIHDGGLMRRLPDEIEPPKQLLLDLNQRIQAYFNAPHIKYTFKKFSNVLATEIDQEEPFYDL